jgi:hypothetical protein
MRGTARLHLLCLILLWVLLPVSAAVAQTPQERLNGARALLKSRPLDGADAAYRALLREQPGTRLAAQAQLGVADVQRVREEQRIQMGMGLTPPLRDEYEKVLAEPGAQAEELAWARHRLAEISYSIDQFEEAIAEHEDVTRQYAGTEAAAASEPAVGDIVASPWNADRNWRAALPHCIAAAQREADTDAGGRAAYKVGEFHYGANRLHEARDRLTGLIGQHGSPGPGGSGTATLPVGLA